MFENNNVGRKCENNISCIKCLDFDKLFPPKVIISKVKATIISGILYQRNKYKFDKLS